MSYGFHKTPAQIAHGKTGQITGSERLKRDFHFSAGIDYYCYF